MITSTIGRPELERAILSVQNQTHPCKHYVFVDGEAYFSKAKAILERYPDVIATYLPMNTGADGWTNSSINAIAPFLVKEDVVCFLDDDNSYTPNHVESIMNTLIESQSGFAYAMRNLVLKDGSFLTQDIAESTGFLPKVTVSADYDFQFDKHFIRLTINDNKKRHIDTNCFGMTLATARLVAPAWVLSRQNDTQVFEELISKGISGTCTKQFTVNYTYEPIGDIKNMKELLKSMNIPEHFAENVMQHYRVQYNFRTYAAYGEKYPWEITQAK